MDGHRPFKVIVVGGGVGGLTLANMFQKFGIDFIVLEAYHDITPDVGASIGLVPSGLRILDQIGCFKAVEAMADELVLYCHFRDSAGNPISSLPQFQDHVQKRHGYPMLWFDRRLALKALYSQLEDPSRIVLRKRARRIDHLADAVRVTTEDGDTFEGSIVVGADGIHSAVRKELVRIAQELPSSVCPPSAFPPCQEDEIPCWYKCSFGIAQNVEGWPERDHGHIFGAGHSALIISGPENRLYWFIFVRLPEVRRGKSIPKFTKEEEEEFAKEYADLQLTETLKWGTVYKKKLHSTLTPLHEMVYKTWFQKRVVLLGDAVHKVSALFVRRPPRAGIVTRTTCAVLLMPEGKPNPILGQGGNGAIESAAELLNALLQARDEHPQGLDGLNDDDFARIFAQMQSARDERIRKGVEEAHQLQALLASENPLVTRLFGWALAWLPNSHWSLQRIGATVVGASRIQSLPMPHRPRAVPFEDERPAPPVKPKTSQTVHHVYAGALLAVAVWAGRAAATAGPASAADVASLWRHAAPILMYTVEGHRVGHRGSLLGVPSAVAIGLHGLGINRAIPLYALLHAVFAFESPPDRHIPPPAAKSVLQAFALGGFASSAKFLFDRYQGVPSDLGSAVMNFSVLFPLLTWGLSKVCRSEKTPRSSKRQDDVQEYLPLSQYETRDMNYLRALYVCAFGVQAAAHVASGAPFCLSHALLKASRASVENPSAILAGLRPLLSGEGLTNIVWVLQNLYAVWDLRRLGYVGTLSGLKAAVGVALGQVLVGPGAVWAAIWCWRDEVFASSMVG